MKTWWAKQATGGRISAGEMYFRNNQPYNRDRAMARAYTSLTPYKRAPMARGTNMEVRRMQAIARGRPRRVPGFPRKRRVKRKRLSFSVPQSAAGSTNSKLYFGNKRMSKEMHTLFKNNQEYIEEGLYSERVTSLFGKQAITLRTLNTSGELNYSMSTIPGLGTTAVANTGKFILGTVKSKLTFTNQDLATAYVSIYSVVPRFNTPSGNAPLTTWDRGLENQTLVPASNLQYTDVYAKPFSSQDFCLFNKVEKVTTFELGQGQSHCHETTYYINKEIHGQLTQTFSYLRDVTKHNLIVVAGTPLNDLTTKSNVSTSSCAVDIVEHQTKTYTYAAAQRTVRFYFNTLGTVNTAEIASVGAGIVVNEDEA